MVIRGLARRWVCLVLACLVTVMLPLCAYAGAGGYRVASGSDADALPDVDARVEAMLGLLEGEIPAVDPGAGALDMAGLADMADVPPGSGLPGLLAGATEEELGRYYQSFLEYPVSLLEWPEEVPQPRFAIAAVGAAAVWVLKLLLVAAGIYVGVEFTENVWQMFQNYETYLRLNGDETLLESWQSILQAQWGGAVTGMVPQYRMFKQFCKEEVQGYGTDVPEYTIIGSGVILLDGPYNPNSKYTLNKYYKYMNSFQVSYMGGSAVIDVFSSSSSKKCIYPHVTSGSYQVCFSTDPDNYGVGSLSFASRTLVDGVYEYYDSSVIDLKKLPIETVASFFTVPVFRDASSASSYILNGTTDGIVVPAGDDEVVVIPEKSWADVQNKDYANPSDTLVVPTDQASADEIEANIAAAAGAADVSKALEKTWELGQLQEGTDEGEDTYPWVPSITGWLEKLAQGIDAIKGWVSAIPDTLSNIRESVQALPQTIAQALEDVVVGEDDGTYSITESVTTKFPFCIPFDLVNCFRILQAEASAPVFRVPFIIDLPAFKFSYEFVLDVSDWEAPIAVIRFFILVIYIGALIYATRYLIKG